MGPIYWSRIRGLAKSVTPLAALLVALVLIAPVASAARIAVVQITHNDVADAETTIAVNPKDPNNLAAGFITGRSEVDQTCGFAVSFSAGRSWTVGRIPGVQKSDGGAFDLGTDPGVAFDKDGNAFYTCLAFNNFPPGTGSAGTIFVSKSTDGGLSWGEPVVAMTGEASPGNSIDEFVDHQFITTNPGTGAVYVTQTRFTSFGKAAILIARSTDGGASFLPPLQANHFDEGAWFQDSYSAASTLSDVVYVSYGSGTNAGLSDWDQIYLAKSTDGGASFARAERLATVVPLPSPLPNAMWRVGNTLFTAVDPETGLIYLVFADYRNGDADIWLLRVRDVGSRFQVDGMTRVNDDPIGNGADQFFPFLTIVNGRIDVCFQDRRYAPGNTLIFATCAFSKDGGLTFTNVQVTTLGFDAADSAFIGDYNMQASTERIVLPIFVSDPTPDGGSADQEIFVARVPV